VNLSPDPAGRLTRAEVLLSNSLDLSHLAIAGNKNHSITLISFFVVLLPLN
jgi:hypothetical protein